MSTKFIYTTVGLGLAVVAAVIVHGFGVGDVGLAGLFIGAGIAAQGANQAHGEANAAAIAKGLEDKK